MAKCEITKLGIECTFDPPTMEQIKALHAVIGIDETTVPEGESVNENDVTIQKYRSDGGRVAYAVSNTLYYRIAEWYADTTLFNEEQLRTLHKLIEEILDE
jgi:hypothetical protein